MARHTAKIRIWGMQANILSVGGYAQIGSAPVTRPQWYRRIWDGKAWGWREGRQQCQADIDWLEVGGVGVSFQGFWARAPFDCDNVDCAFENGNVVDVRVITILIIAIQKVTMRFCETKTVSWRVRFGLGLGVQGAKWKIQNTRHW